MAMKRLRSREAIAIKKYFMLDDDLFEIDDDEMYELPWEMCWLTQIY